MEITSREYLAFETAYNHLNKELFGNRLSGCLITINTKMKATAYYYAHRFFKRGDEDTTTDELALNPTTFPGVTDVKIMSHMVHEMVHLWQYLFGTPSVRSYHNREWSNMMIKIGLMPSSTGRPGGRKVGQSMSDYIIDGGPFQRAAQDLVDSGFCFTWQAYPEPKQRRQPSPTTDAMPTRSGSMSLPAIPDEELPPVQSKNKVKFSCPVCPNHNAWGKPGLNVICGICHTPFEPQERTGLNH